MHFDPQELLLKRSRERILSVYPVFLFSFEPTVVQQLTTDVVEREQQNPENCFHTKSRKRALEKCFCMQIVAIQASESVNLECRSMCGWRVDEKFSPS